MSNFYVADTHFGHENIIRLCNRPFKNAEEMDEVLIQNWNSVVTDADTVYILGDLAFSKGEKKPSDYLRELKGRKIMILGNHDYDISKNIRRYIDNRYLDSIHDYFELFEDIGSDRRKVVLSHYPMVEWNGYFRNSIHLYGHIHNNVENNAYKIMRNIDNAYNVGVDIINYMPQRLEDVIKLNKNFIENH